MKNIQKNIFVLLATVISTVAMAADTAMITLNGVTKENRTGIEKLAKENGAKKASLDVKTGSLKVSGAAFHKDQFENKLTAEFPGVSVK